MACEVLKQYSKNDYFDIYVELELAGEDPIARSDVFESLHKTYEPSIADAIQAAIESGTFNENWDIEPGISPSPVETPFNVNGAKNSEPEDTTLSDYYYNKQNGYVRLSNMTTRFFDDIVSRALFNKSTGAFYRPTTDSVNAALYDYKVELLHKLWDFTGKSYEVELISSDENLTSVISRTLSDFANLSNTKEADAYWDDYIILKQFDKLLSDYAPFIKKDAAFKNTSAQSKKMYIWDPSGTYRQSWTDSEDSDISKTTSPLVRMLADYFTCADASGREINRPIGFTTFNIAMATLATWLRENRLDIYVDEVNRDIRKNGLNADFGRAIDVYIERGNPNDSLKEVLYGLKKHIFKKNIAIPTSIRDAFANQFFLTAKYSYMAYRQNFDNGDYDVSGQYLEDSFIDLKTSSLMRTVQNKVWFYQGNPELFNRLKNKHHIGVTSKDGVISIKFDGSHWGKDFIITVSNDGETITINNPITSGNELSQKAIIDLVQDTLDTLIPTDYENVLAAMSVSAPVSATLFSTFISPISILLAASSESRNFSYVFNYNDETELLKTYPFQQRFVQSGKFQSIVDGINDLNVLKNGEGNNLPIYQLAPAVFDIFTIIDEIKDTGKKGKGSLSLESTISKDPSNWYASKEIPNVFVDNLFITAKDLLKKIIIRSDVKIGGITKSSDKLTASEVASLAIFNDFYQNLVREPDANNPNALSGTILLQPITYSDKKTHFLPAIDLTELLIKVEGNRETALKVFSEIVSPSENGRYKYIKAVENEIIRVIGSKTKRQIYNQYLRFQNVFQGLSAYENVQFVTKDGTVLSGETARTAVLKDVTFLVPTNIDNFNATDGFKTIYTILQNLNQFKNPIEILRQMFKTKGTVLNEDFDIIALKNGNVQANESLFYNLNTYTPQGISGYLTQEKIKFAFDLQEYGVTMDTITHPELRKYINRFSTDQKRVWYDPHSGIMRMFRVFETKNGKQTEIFPTQAEFESNEFKHNPNITVQLNPMVEGFFYANALFGSQFNDILFGGTEGYIPKYADAINFEDPNQSVIGQMMASRLANEFKRTTYGGAIKRKFAQGRKFGVSPKIRFSVVEDDTPTITTLRGQEHSQVAQDGSGWVIPFLGRMIQDSLVDSPVGDVRKTIAGWVDPRTGTQVHFKWAETTITAGLRQKAQGDGSAEVMYRKATSAIDITDKLRNLPTDLSMYYNTFETGKSYVVLDHIVTRIKPIYRYDLDAGQYWKLEAIRNTAKGFQTAWSLVDKNGSPIYRDASPVRQVLTKELHTLYDLDQMLGGAFVFELDENGDMVSSEGVHDIIYNIICMNDMKDDFVGYIVNHSACKAGAFNVNDYATLNNDDTSLNHHYLSSFGIGVQMDADHEMDFASVTEMSQMISLLTQSGTNIDTVNKAYQDIGKVAAEAMRDILAAVNTDDEDVYRIIGKALLDTFDSGAKQELGLAQAFIRNAQNAILKEKGLDNIILPYSAESVRGSFVAAVTSLINKKGIKRKYSGFGGVQVPADKTMQHYRMANGVITDYIGLRDRIKPILQKNNITWEQAQNQQIINGQLNPFLKKIDQKSVQLEDTVMYRPKGSVEEGVVVKLDSQKEFDLVRNLLDPDLFDVYVWTVKPRELAQSDIRITTSLGELSEYDIDPVRASFYLSELIDVASGKKALTDIDFLDRKIAVINAAIQDSDLIADGTQIASMQDLLRMDVSMLNNLKKLCVHKAQSYFNELSNIIKSGISGELPVQMASVNDDINRYLSWGNSKTNTVSPKIRNIVAQAVIGRRNFKKFGLRKGDKLSDIKEKKDRFFYKRLLEQSGQIDRVQSQLKRTRYDGIVQLSNGEFLLVLVGDQSDNLKNFGQTNDFVISDDAVSYKGQVLFDNRKLKGLGKVIDFTYLSYVNDTTGQSMPVIMVPSYDVFDRIGQSEAVVSSLYNYNATNTFDILRHRYASNFNKDGNLIAPFITESGVQITEEDDTLMKINGTVPENLWDVLNKKEHIVWKDKLKRKAKLLYRNFIKQLNYIQTRIPSQAMQSTSNIEIIDFADTDTNYIWVPKIIFLLQGSDLDIDKAYCMGYDVDDSGNIYAQSDLIYDSKYDVDDVLALDDPHNWQINSYIYDSSSSTPAGDPETFLDITELFDELIANGSSDIQIINSIINAINVKFGINPGFGIQVFYDTHNGVYKNGAKELDRFMGIMRDISRHERSQRSESEIEHALRNQVLSSARKIMNNPASQLDAYTPIAMKEPRDASKLNTALGSKEKEMTLDNPMSIFLMQIQNMSGKEVIAMTATGIKSYFMVTTYFNTLVKQIENDLREYVRTKDTKLINNIVAALNEITFDGKLDGSTEPYLYTFANINLYEIKKIINANRGEFSAIGYTADVQPTKANTAFARYANNGTLLLADLIDDLDKRANGNVWQINDKGDYNYFVVNAPDSLSALLSAATDNAKELILDKLNATSKFADIYTTLLSQGVPFIKIAQMMTNNAFRIVAKYAQSNIFDKDTNKFNVTSAIDFVLNEAQLPNISRGLFEKFLTDNYGITDEHKQEGYLHQIIREAKSVYFGDKVASISELIYDRFLKATSISEAELLDTLRQSNLSVNINKNSAAIIGAVIDKGTNNWKNTIAKIILDLFNDRDYRLVDGDLRLSDYMKNLLLNNLTVSLSNYVKVFNSETNESQPDEIDVDPIEAMFDDESEWDESVRSLSETQSYWFKGPIRKIDLQRLYRYIKQYFIPKTELWNALDVDAQKQARSDFEKLRSQILYATKEMRMLGAFGSINQGMRTKDYDEYRFVARIEQFINSAYIRRGDGKIKEQFDLLRFLNDSDYRNRHIRYYDEVKATINILRAIDTTANFKEMFNYIGVNRNMIEKSAAVRLERSVIKQLLESSTKTDEETGINKGVLTVLNDQEFRIVSKYIRDSIVYNFFRNLDNLRFNVPTGQQYYNPTNTTTADPSLIIARNIKSLSLGNIHNLATFKHLMDWYIIPKLQMDSRFQDNAFIKNLTRDRIRDEKTGKSIVSFKVNVPLINIDSSPKAKQKYSDILTAFNRLLYMPLDSELASEHYGIGEGWTIGNLFFIYNLLVNKDRIGANAMTRLFEDVISSGNTYSLPYIYYKYMSDLDTGKLDASNPDVFLLDLRDLKYRLSGMPEADSHFDVTQEKAGNVVTKVKVTHDSETEEIEPSTDVKIISDYVLDLPFATKQTDNLRGRTHAKYGSGFNSEDTILASSDTVFNALSEELASTYGKEIPIEILTEDEIDSEFSDLTEDERNAMKDATGFIVDGNIYLNGTKNSLDAPMHEIMHFIAAAMKFNKDPKIRSSYYKLLDWVTDWLDGRVKSGNSDDAELKRILLDKAGQYGNRHMSDIKEEILVTLLAREFKSSFYNTWGDSRTINKQMIQANIKQVLSEILNTDKILDLDFNELGNATLSSVLKKFASQILSVDSTLLTMSIHQNQEMAELKDLLIKGGFIELSEDCL